MYLELASIFLSASGVAAVVRHYFRQLEDRILLECEELHRKLEAEVEEMVNGIDLEKLRQDFQTHVSRHVEGVIQSSVAEEVRSKLRVAEVATCDSCQRQVAQFETHEGRKQCPNCQRKGK